MAAMKEIYKQLTNVDIEQQKQIWDERGKGYYGEYLLFCDLYKYVIGNCKILMNLNIPTNDAKTTEIDLLLIHETGLYVFEIKHYKGIIYGKDTDNIWTQYFRTAPNHTFKNPIEQNDYHIRALARLFPNLPIHSIVVFTSDDCDIRVSNTNPCIDICVLRDVQMVISNRFQNADFRFSMEEIDDIFNQLSIYSPMRENISIDNAEASFFSWIQPIIAGLEDKKTEIAHEKDILISQEKKVKKIKNRGILLNIAIALLCIIVSIITINDFRVNYGRALQKNNSEVIKLKQEFSHIDEIINGNIRTLNTYVNVTNVILSPTAGNTVSFTATLTILSDTYGIVIQENAKYIVTNDSGKIFEYDVFGTHLAYSYDTNKLVNGKNKSGNLAKVQFGEIHDTSEISCIELAGIQLIKADTSQTVIKNDLTIDLYSK